MSVSAKGAFSFVSNFESTTLEGWTGVQGAAPQVVSSPNYSGEPALRSAASSGPQMDFANRGFITGASSISFQVAMRTKPNSGDYFGLGSPNTGFSAVVGVRGNNVVAGRDLGSLGVVEAIPTWPFDTGKLERFIAIFLSVIAIVLARLIQVAFHF